MEPLLKFIAAAIFGAMIALWFWGLALVGQSGHDSNAFVLLLFAIGAVVLCWLAWLMRNARLRASAHATLIDPKLMRDRALAVLGLIVLFFVFTLMLDRLGNRPHETLGLAAVFAAWFSIGIASLVICAVCFVGGGRRGR